MLRVKGTVPLEYIELQLLQSEANLNPKVLRKQTLYKRSNATPDEGEDFEKEVCTCV